MLVISRDAGESVVVELGDETAVVTVLKVLSKRRAVAVRVSRAPAARPEERDRRNVEVALDDTIKIGERVEMTLVDLGGNKAYLGISAPRDGTVHRLEVYEAIARERRRADNMRDQDGGASGSPVPRPPTPKPPTLNARLDEPRPTDEGGE